MSIVYDRYGVTVHHGDCLDVLAALPDASVAAVVTDPPYGLADHAPAMIAAALMAWATGDRRRVPNGAGGFMGNPWDTFVPPPAVWDECLRVLKPGGHLLAFAGTRTADIMGLSIRMAGFEIRDSIAWLYATGFPKSLDVSKAIYKAAGAGREVVGRKTLPNGQPRREEGPGTRADGSGWARPWQTDPVAIEARTHITAPATDAARAWQGWGTALKPAFEPIVVARKPLAGTVAGNVLEHGAGALNIDGCRIATAAGDYAHPGNNNRAHTDTAYNRFEREGRQAPPHAAGRWPSNVVLTHAATPDGVDLCVDGCVLGCPVRDLDEQAGVRTSGVLTPAHNLKERHSDSMSGKNTADRVRREYAANSGGASRFFPVFRFEAKAPSSERPRVDGVAHPTVKPLALMRWLVRLVTPPGGIVLDPFLGSGTTAQAARAEGCRCVGVEREETYLPLIRARLDGDGLDLFGGGDAA